MYIAIQNNAISEVRSMIGFYGEIKRDRQLCNAYVKGIMSEVEREIFHPSPVQRLNIGLIIRFSIKFI